MPMKKIGRKQQSLLVVEDDDEQRQRLTSALEQLYPDLTVESAQDYAEAIAKFDYRPFDLVLLDMRLGTGPDGLALLQTLRRRTTPFRAIGVSDFVNDYAFRAWKTGLDELLEKPVAPDELTAAIDKQLTLVRDQARIKRKAFCVMPFSPDMEDRYLFGIKMAAERAGYICNRSDEKYFTGDILMQIQKDIRATDIVIADISGNNPNVCYEVGFAHALRKPVILVTDSTEGALFDIRNMRYILFTGKIHKLLEELEKTLKELDAGP